MERKIMYVHTWCTWGQKILSGIHPLAPSTFYVRQGGSLTWNFTTYVRLAGPQAPKSLPVSASHLPPLEFRGMSVCLALCGFQAPDSDPHVRDLSTFPAESFPAGVWFLYGTLSCFSEPSLPHWNCRIHGLVPHMLFIQAPAIRWLLLGHRQPERRLNREGTGGTAGMRLNGADVRGSAMWPYTLLGRSHGRWHRTCEAVVFYSL